MLLLQGYATIGVIQGREMLKVMNTEPDYLWSNCVYGLALILSGMLYFVGAYWLLFFSTIRANLYDIPENYSEFSLKIRAADYHDFMDLNRTQIIGHYTGFLLFGPFFILLAALFVVDGPTPYLAVLTLATGIFNGMVLYLRSHRNAFLVLILSRTLTKFDASLFWIWSKGAQILNAIFPSLKPKSPQEQYLIQSLTTEKKVHSIRQALPMHRGGFYLLIFLSLGLWVALLWLPESRIQALGALTCLQIGLCFWIVIVVYIEYLNKRVALPVRFVLFAWLIFCSAVNSDFPVRISTESLRPEAPILPENAMDQWLKSRSDFADSTSKGFIVVGGKKYCPSQPFPVWIVCAEGGASRSGYWTAAMLDQLGRREKELFDRHLFAISAVSGGSLGSLVYAEARLGLKRDSLAGKLDAFFSTDFLAPLTNRLVAGGPILWMSPVYDPFFDRAVSLENSLNKAFENTFGKQRRDKQIFQGKSFKNGEFDPLILFNSVEVETGRRSVLSNRNLDLRSNPQVVNVNQLLQNRGLDYAGAIHLSARFPVFSPSGALIDDHCKTHHFVDGGYYDNVGYETANDLVQSIKKSPYSLYFRPVIIALVNSFENSESIVETRLTGNSEPLVPTYKPDRGTYFLNEPLSIFEASANIRSANTDMHWRHLIHEMELPIDVKKPASRFFKFDLNASKEIIPLNWRISHLGREKLRARSVSAMKQLDFHPKLKAPIGLGLDVFCTITKPKNMEVVPVKNQKTKSETAYSTQIRKSIMQADPANISPATHPQLYYYSLKQKKWVLKSKADFPLNQMKRWSGKKHGGQAQYRKK